MDNMHAQPLGSCPYSEALERVAPAGSVRLKHPSRRMPEASWDSPSAILSIFTFTS